MKKAVAIATLISSLATPAAFAASFNCDQPGLSANEQAICNHRDLNDYDVEMATMLRLLSGLFPMGTRHNMQDEQAAWLRERMACGADTSCIRNSYKKRIGALQAMYDAIDRPI